MSDQVVGPPPASPPERASMSVRGLLTVKDLQLAASIVADAATEAIESADEDVIAEAPTLLKLSRDLDIAAFEMVRAADAPRAAHPSEKGEQVAWLVALGSMPPRWWTGRGDEFTTDVDGTQRNPACAAMRFARREDAERAIGWLVKEGVKEGCRAEEHIWL